MKVIFLDFDGVLNSSYNCYRPSKTGAKAADEYGSVFDPDCVSCLRKIVDATGAEIVITSSWKRTMDYRLILQMWQARELPGFVTDVTPTVSRHRGDEIDQWLKDAKNVEEYVILDDLDYPNFNPSQYSHLVVTDGYYGLNEKASQQAINILNHTSMTYEELPSRINLNVANPALLIVPDVHGRTFWKSAVKAYPQLPVIFLGDYLDPYDNAIESISHTEAWINFCEILEYKKENTGKVTLLLGNHDVHYFSKDKYGDRKDLDNEDVIRATFSQLLHHFQLVSPFSVEGHEYLFSHAGLKREWYAKYFHLTEDMSITSISETLNRAAADVDSLTNFLSNGLCDVSGYRLGPCAVGSVVLADMHEFQPQEAEFDEVYQVFGHTQQEKYPVIKKTFANLDCRRAFILTEEGEFIQI